MFFRKSSIEPLPITMSGVRMGERLLQIGIDDPSHAGALAAKVGLSGNSAIAVRDDAGAARARQAAAAAAVLIDVQVTPLHALPFEKDVFDVIVVHGLNGWIADLDGKTRDALLREAHRVLRPGGRLVSVEPGPKSGLGARLRPSRINAQYESAGGTITALQAAGFRSARVIGEREGYRFVEALKS